MNFIKTALSLAFLVLFQATTIAQDWVSYQSQQKINDLVDTGDELLMATDRGLVVMNKSTLEKSFFNKSNTDLANNHIQTITQSVDGSTWIGTYDVVIMRFDGTDFQEMIIPEGNFNPNTVELYDLKVAPNGDLWVSTNEGLFHRHGQAWSQYDETILGDSFERVWDVEITENGDVYVGAFQIFKYSNGSWSNISDTTQLSSYLHADLFFSASGDLFYNGDLDRIGRFDGEHWEEYVHGLNGSEIKGFTEDGNGNVYFQSQRDGIFKLENNTWTKQVNAQTEAFDDNISYFYIDEEGNRWLNNNIHLSVNKNGNIQSTLIAPHTLESNNVSNFHKGDNGKLYFMASSIDNFSVLDTDGNWSFLPKPLSAMPFEVFNDILAFADHDIWLASGTGLYHFDGNDWTFMDVEPCRSFAVDSQGKIYVTSVNRVYILENGGISEYNLNNSPLSDLILFGLGVDANDNLWLSLFDWNESSLIQKVSSDGSTWTNYTDAEHPVINHPNGNFHFDINGNVWMPLSGVGAIKFDGNEWTNPFEGNIGQMENYAAQSIESDASGTVYFSHQYGVTTLLDGEWGDLVIENVPNGNTSANSTIHFDDDGTLWWASNRHGVFSHTPETTTAVSSDLPTNTDFSIYPNPAQDYFILDFNMQETANVKAMIYNSLGQLQLHLDLEQLPAGIFQERIDLTQFPAGLYHLQLQINNQPITKTIIVL